MFSCNDGGPLSSGSECCTVSSSRYHHPADFPKCLFGLHREGCTTSEQCILYILETPAFFTLCFQDLRAANQSVSWQGIGSGTAQVSLLLWLCNGVPRIASCDRVIPENKILAGNRSEKIRVHRLGIRRGGESSPQQLHCPVTSEAEVEHVFTLLDVDRSGKIELVRFVWRSYLGNARDGQRKTSSGFVLQLRA